jgi:hypothetical protein
MAALQESLQHAWSLADIARCFEELPEPEFHEDAGNANRCSDDRPLATPEISDRDQCWRIKAGLSSGPPPRRPKEKPPDGNQRGLDFPIRGETQSPEFNRGSEKIQTEFFGREPCAPSVRETLTLTDFADLKFAWQISRLAKRGERALYEFFCELAARHLIRTSVENMLAEYLGDHGEGGR